MGLMCFNMLVVGQSDLFQGGMTVTHATVEVAHHPHLGNSVHHTIIQQPMLRSTISVPSGMRVKPKTDTPRSIPNMHTRGGMLKPSKAKL